MPSWWSVDYMLNTSVGGCGFNLVQGQTKYFKIDICRFPKVRTWHIGVRANTNGLGVQIICYRGYISIAK